MGMSPEQADDWYSEHGSLSPQQVWNRERDQREDEARVLSGQILADMAIEARAAATEVAIRANEIDAFTDRWVCVNPDAERVEMIRRRRAQAEAVREEAAILRRRAYALEDGAVALGAKVPD